MAPIKPAPIKEGGEGRSGLTGFRRRLRRRFRRRFREALVQSQVRFNRICGHLTHGNPAEVFPALGSAARFRKSCKHKKLWPLGIPPKLIFYPIIYIYIYNTTAIVGVRVRFVEIDPLRCSTWAVCFPRCLLECVQWGFEPFLDYLVLCGRFVGKITVTK